MIKIGILLSLLCCVGFSSTPLSASESTPIGWAGWGFLAPADSIKKLAPNTLAAINRFPALNDAVSLRLQRQLEKSLQTREDLQLISYNIEYGDDAYVLFCAIAADYVELRQVKEDTIAEYNLQALVLVLNVSKETDRRRIVSNIPVRVRWRELRKSAPTLDERVEVFARMLSAPEGDMPDLVAEWTNQAARIEFRERDKWLRIAPTVLSDKARAVLEEHASGVYEQDVVEQLPMRTAALLEGQVSQLLNVPVVPFGASSAVDNMVMEVSDRRAARDILGSQGSGAIGIPKADRTIVLVVDELRIISHDLTTARGTRNEGKTYAARLYFRVVEGEDTGEAGKILLEIPLKVVKSDDKLADIVLSVPQEFARLLAQFSRELGEALANADGKWFELARSAQEIRKPKEVERAVSRMRQVLSQRSAF